jgi:2-hydroxy-6-oxonona-2,4-dienedioate hydrolase
MSVAETAITQMEQSTSRLVQTAKWRLHYNEAGKGEPVIMLHGMGPGATAWSNFHQNFQELARHYHVILLDFPGFGKSDPFICSETSRHVANAEAVKFLMDALGIDRAALVGNSMGGACVLQFAATYSDRITHAVTMGAGIFNMPNIFTPGGLSEGIRTILETYANPTPENFRRLVSIMVYDSSFVTDALMRERSDGALANREHLENLLKAPMGPHGNPFAGIESLLTKLSQSQVPTLMIHGRDDRVVAMETSLRTSALIPNSRVVVLNRCGHWAQVEHASEFNNLLVGFLGHDPQSSGETTGFGS